MSSPQPVPSPKAAPAIRRGESGKVNLQLRVRTVVTLKPEPPDPNDRTNWRLILAVVGSTITFCALFAALMMYLHLGSE